MARPKDTAIMQRLKGVGKNHPERLRNDPVPSGPIGDPPARLKAIEKAIWRELVQIAIPGMLGNSDRPAFETLCRLKAIERRHGIGGKDGLNGSQLSALNALYAKFGLTPSARAQVGCGGGNPAKNEFEEFSTTEEQIQ